MRGTFSVQVQSKSPVYTSPTIENLKGQNSLLHLYFYICIGKITKKNEHTYSNRKNRQKENKKINIENNINFAIGKCYWSKSPV